MEKLKSKYTTKEIMPAQWLAERICERIARKRKEALSDHFWNQSKWKKTFLYQVQLANSLLKIYSWQAIARALKNNPGIYSLGAQFFDPHIKHEEEALAREEALRLTKQDEVLADPTAKPRPTFTEDKSIRSKLRDL